MRIVVFETSCDGHRFVYLKLLLPAIAKLADEVVVSLPADAPGTREFKQLLAPLADQVTFDMWMPSLAGKPFSGALHKLSLLRQSIARANAQYLIVPHLDGLAQSLGLMRSVGGRTIPRDVISEGLLLRGGFAYHEPRMSQRIKKQLSWRLARRCPMTYMHHLDPLVYEQIRHQPDAARWLLMPDPVEQPAPMSRTDARRMLGIPEDGRYVGCAGGIDKRKGVHLLLAAFAEAKLGATDRLLLMGAHHEEIKSLLRDPYAALVRDGRIVSKDAFVEIEQLHAGVAAMDLVCTFYPQHVGIASIVLRAAAAQRPVLAADFGWMGMVVPRIGLGAICDVNDTPTTAKALTAALDAAPDFRQTEAGRRFCAFHSVENFQTTWTVRLRQTLGLPPAPECRSWDWVLDAAQP